MRRPLQIDQATGKLKISESMIQRQIVQYLENVLGAVVLENRSSSVLSQVHGGKRAKGSPDLVAGLPGGCVLWIEVKRPGKHLLPEQSEWRDELLRRGHHHVLATSFEDVAEYVRKVRAGI